MDNTSKDHPNRQSLPVLPHSGKIEQLKQDAASAGSTAGGGIPPLRTFTDPNPPAGAGGAAAALTPEQKAIEQKVVAALRTVFDPEIPVSIYELGLVYNVRVNPDHSVHVRMTLTAPACPVAGSLPGEVESKIENIPEVKSATVELVWDPPWDRSMMSEAAQLQLGLL